MNDLQGSYGPGTVLAHRYRVLSLLGSGGMGEVYEAWDAALEIRLALKILPRALARDDEMLRRLKQELLLARSVTHRNVCRVYDSARHEQDGAALWFLTMELVPGATLAARLEARGSLTPAEVLPLAEQMAAGLGAAHRAGVVHRDFKCENVMLSPVEGGGERVVVTDFGVASAGAATPASEVGLLIGTPAYMAPEQVRGEPAGPAADIYALGVVLFELLTGRLPFTGDSALETATRRLVVPPPSPRALVPSLDPAWESILMRCLAVEPGNRFEQVEDVAVALAARPGARAPAARAPEPQRHALPFERDAFFGRDEDLARIERRFESGATLVTLLGVGGIGKTRLAIRFGWQQLARWTGGVWFCDLTEATERDGVASALATTLGVSLGSGDVVRQLGRAVADRGECLVILDNLEQVLEVAGEVVRRLAEAAPQARLLVTSRARLGIAEEVTETVEPLSETAGVEMFIERAGRHRPGFDPGAEEREALRRIVAMLEGMPLAIELAAARMRVLSVAQLGEGMRDRFRVLAQGGRGRHAALEAVFQESWQMLTATEQQALAQCAVFEGGFTLAAAEAVLDLGSSAGTAWVVDVIQSLLDRSLLRVWVPAATGASMPEARFGMYVSLQEFVAREPGHPGSKGEPARVIADAERRHARWYAGYGQPGTMEALERRGDVRGLRVLERELDNLMAAARRALAAGEGQTALACLRAAWAVLEVRGPFAPAVELGRRALALPLARTERALALLLLGRAEWSAGESMQALAHLEAALAAQREIGARADEATLLMHLGKLHLDQGRMDEARAYLRDALAIERELGDPRAEGLVLGHLGVLAFEQGAMGEAHELLDAAIARHHEAGNRREEANAIGNLGIVHHEQGRFDQARACYDTAILIHRELGTRRFEGNVTGNLAILDRQQGRPDEALVHYQAALAIHREVGNRWFEGNVTGRLGQLHHEQGRLDEARAAYLAALAIHRETGNRRSEGMILGQLGRLDLDAGAVDRALQHLSRAESLLRRVTDSNELIKVLCARSDLELRSGRPASARACLEEADRLAVGVGAGPASETAGERTRVRAALARLAIDALDPPGTHP